MMKRLPLVTLTIRILPPAEEMANDVMDRALAALDSMRAQQRIEQFIRSDILGADALDGFEVVVEPMDAR